MLKKNTLESSFLSTEFSSSETIPFGTAASPSASPSTKKNSSTTAFMLNEFVVGCDRFHVIIIESLQADADVKNLLIPFLLSLGVEHFSEVTRFPVQGRLFIIVKTEHLEAGRLEVGCLKIDNSATEKEDALREMQALLTERELQIAALVALGKVNKQIAKQLQISEWTVATYLRRMFAKLRVDSRAALVYRCAPLIRRFQALSQSVVER